MNEICEDGSLGSVSSACAYGSDCTDCGWRAFSPPGLPPDLPPPPSFPPPSNPPQTPPPSPPPVHCSLLYGVGDCSEYNFCSRQGTCNAGLCDCDVGFTGLSCDILVECKYWDNALGDWNTDGCVSSPPPTGRPDGYLYCNCTHLTDFGGVGIPTSAEELLAEFTSMQFATFTMDESIT